MTLVQTQTCVSLTALLKVFEELRLVCRRSNQWSKVNCAWNLGPRGYESSSLASAMMAMDTDSSETPIEWLMFIFTTPHGRTGLLIVFSGAD